LGLMWEKKKTTTEEKKGKKKKSYPFATTEKGI